MGRVLEWKTARAARGAPDEAVAAGAEAAARLLTEPEIAKARLDRSFAVLRDEDPLAAEIYALRRALSSLDLMRGVRAPNARACRHGQRTVGGRDDRIDATLPPVLRPKIVPRS
jgi:hypothetical protein